LASGRYRRFLHSRPGTPTPGRFFVREWRGPAFAGMTVSESCFRLRRHPPLSREAAMSRSERLLDLIQALRRHRRPVSGASLAAELDVSLRTVYRDIQSLIATGAPIDGEAGVGYVLRSGYTLPPLMFTDEEIEAVVLGSHMVAGSTDARLARAPRDALAKVRAVLPDEKRDSIEAAGLLAAPRPPLAPDGVDLALLRGAI